MAFDLARPVRTNVATRCAVEYGAGLHRLAETLAWPSCRYVQAYTAVRPYAENLISASHVTLTTTTPLRAGGHSVPSPTQTFPLFLLTNFTFTVGINNQPY